VITITGLVLLPVMLLSLRASLRVQLAVLFMCAVLSSAAVINLASFGVQPGYFMGVALIGTWVAFALVRGEFYLDRRVALTCLPLLVLLLAALNALFWGNALFGDDVRVVSGRQAYNLAAAERYTFRNENVNQLVYFSFNALLAALLANILVRRDGREMLWLGRSGVLAAFWFATFFVAWDWLAKHYGIYFPESFLHSNAFYAAAHAQGFDGVPRISGPFSEPSGLAYAYGGFLFHASAEFVVYRRASSFARMLIALGALTISTSTTAYALLGAWTLAAALWGAPLLGSALGRVPSLTVRRLAVPALAALAVGGAVLVASNSQDAIQTVLDNAVRGKTETGSYATRTGAEAMGFKALVDTYGLGVGLGSHRPNSLAMTLLSNTGIPGALAFLTFIALVLRRPPSPDFADAESRRELWPVRALLLGFLLGHCISNPNLSNQVLWLALALNLAAATHRGAVNTTPRVQVLGPRRHARRNLARMRAAGRESPASPA
jgi:hypothetical protein